MLLVVGLGNPGDKYTNTPHNAGFAFVDAFREFLGWDTLYSVDDWKADKMFECQMAFARVGASQRILLIKPLTFMNASGRAVKKVMDKFEIKPKDLVLAHDDLDIKLGEYKIQMGKGPKAHNGVDSVQMLLGTTQFMRVRIGVENRTPETRIPGEDYVLMKMKEEERLTLDEACADAVKGLRGMLGV